MWRRTMRGVSVAAALGLVLACAQGQSSVDPGFGLDVDPDAGSASDARVPPREGGARDASGPKDDSGKGGPCDGKVVINELQCNGANNAEFIELYNPSDCAVDLSGWTIPYRAKNGNSGLAIHSFDPGDTIAAGAFLLLANDAFGGGGGVMRFNGSGGGLGNDGGQVALVDADDNQIDALGYGSETTGTFTEGAPAALPAASASVGRKSDGVDTDNNSADFKIYATPSPGVGN